MEKFKVLFVFLLSFCVSMVMGQQYTPMTAAGYAMKRVKVDSTLHLPSFCGVPTLRNSTAINGALAMDTCGNKLYKWTHQNGWTIVGQIIDTSIYVKYTDTSAMLAPYAKTIYVNAQLATKLNISDTSGMLAPYLRSNIAAATYQPIGSYLVPADTANKWITNVYRKTATDSVFYIKGGNSTFAFIDSTGGGGGQNGRFGNDTATIVMAKVHNDAGSPLTNGEVVYLSTSGTNSDVPSVKRAKNTGDSTSANTFGFVTGTINTHDTGWVILSGKIEKLNTAAYNNGDIIYLDSIAGKFTKTKPQAPYHLVYLGVVIKSNAGNGAIFAKPQNGYELDELHNVKINGIVNNQVLAYSDTQKLWKNRNIYSIVDTASFLSPYQRANDAVTLSTTQTITGQKTFNPSVTASSAIGRGTFMTPALTAAANNDVLVGLDINPTFTNGAFTGLQNIGLRLNSNSSSVTENLSLYNASNGGGSGASIRFRNGYTGSGQGMIWDAIDFVFAAGGGGNLLLKTSNALGADATTKMTIGTTSITSNVVHSFSAGISGQTDIYRGATTDPAAGINKTIVANISSGGATPGASIAVGNTGSYSANNSAYGIYINNTATVSGTGQKFNIFSAGTSLNHFNGNTLIGTTTDAGFKFDVNGTSRFQDNITIGADKFLNSAGGGNVGIYFGTTGNLRGAWSTGTVGANIGSLSVGGAGTPAVASAMLEVISTTRGFLPPRMTTTQRDAISTPAAGLIIYNTTTNKHQGYNGTTWNDFY